MKKYFTIITLLLQGILLQSQVQVGMSINGNFAGEQLGQSVAMSADGSRMATSAVGDSSFFVRLYEKNNEDWMPLGNNITSASPFHRTGWSIDLSADGHRVAIGSPNDDSPGAAPGYVEVYEYMEGDWKRLGEVIMPDTSNTSFGFSVSLTADGKRVAIGEPTRTGILDFRGFTHIYEYNDSTWVRMSSNIFGEHPADKMGYQVALSPDGSWLASAGIANDNEGNQVGCVLTYQYNESQGWHRQGLALFGDAIGNEMGSALSFSQDGERLAIGSYLADNGDIVDAGKVQVYLLFSGGWHPLGFPIFGETENEQLGHLATVDLSADGTRLVIGSPLYDGHEAMNVGKVRFFEYIPDEFDWSPLHMPITGQNEGDELGKSVALIAADSTVVVIGIPNHDDQAQDAGQVQVFDFSVVSDVEIIDSAPSIQIYPNPSADVLTISGIKPNEGLVQVINATGQIVQTMVLNAQQLNLSDVPTGTYFLKIPTEQGTVIKKFIKK